MTVWVITFEGGGYGCCGDSTTYIEGAYATAELAEARLAKMIETKGYGFCPEIEEVRVVDKIEW